MSEIRFARSPIVMGHTLTTSAPNGSASLQLVINGNVRNLLKNNLTNGNKSAYFEVAEIIRDEINVYFTGSHISHGVSVTMNFEMTDAQNGGGNTLYTDSQSFIAVEGFSYHEEGQVIVSTPPERFAFTERNWYLPEGVTSVYPKFFNNISLAFSYVTVQPSVNTITLNGETVTIKRFCSPKYEPHRVTFLNKYGALQDIWFELVRRDTTEIQSKKYKRFTTNPDGSLDVYAHNIKKYNAQGHEKFTLNSGYRDEDFNGTMDELLMSEYVWVWYAGQGSTIRPRPCNVLTTSVQKKTHVNDKLIQYEVQFEEAYDKIYNVR